MESKRFELNRADVNSWLKVAGLFLAPVFVIYITFVLGNINDGFAWSDFVPSVFVQGAMVAYILNELLALLKKWVEGKE